METIIGITCFLIIGGIFGLNVYVVSTVKKQMEDKDKAWNIKPEMSRKR